ncbi:MAG: mycothiol system anti-sigma-R factor [Actinobacteria bacterium]|nr:mycothiol system anti-sigma-R factor [Actinomycetota bacterium]
MSDNCSGVLNDLYTFLDGELTDESRAHVEAHLRECSPCLEAFDFEAEIRKVIANRCHDQCPDELRNKILAAIEASGDEAHDPTQ